MRVLFPALLACALCTTAFAEEKIPASPSATLCRENRDKCEEMQDRRAEFCKNNPQTCEKRRHLRAERKDEKLKDEKQERRVRFCKQHPDQCPNRHDDEEQFHPHTTAPGDHSPGPPR